MIRMCKVIVLPFIIVCLLMQDAFAAELHANVVLEGDTKGLSFTSDTHLFNINDMWPSESATSTFTIKNNDEYPFNLYVTMYNKNRPEGNDVDLLDALVFNFIDANGQSLTGFDMKGQAAPPDPRGYFLGRFSPGSDITFNATVTFMKEATSVYEGKKAVLQWVFYAESERPNMPPDDDGGGGGGGTGSGGTSGGGGRDNVSIGATRTPLSSPVFTIPDNETPLAGSGQTNAGKTLPKAGKASLLFNYLFGIILVGLGIAILCYRRKNVKTIF